MWDVITDDEMNTDVIVFHKEHSIPLDLIQSAAFNIANQISYFIHNDLQHQFNVVFANYSTGMSVVYASYIYSCLIQGRDLPPDQSFSQSCIYERKVNNHDVYGRFDVTATFNSGQPIVVLDIKIERGNDAFHFHDIGNSYYMFKLAFDDKTVIIEHDMRHNY
jgi:hypothetical protein